MTLSVKTMVLALGLAVLPLCAADVTGKWKLDGDVQGNPIKGDCEFKQDGAAFTGVCKMGDGQEVKVTGGFKEESIVFTHDIDHEGTNYTLSYTGKPDGEKAYKGDIDVAGYSGVFTLVKQ